MNILLAVGIDSGTWDTAQHPHFFWNSYQPTDFSMTLSVWEYYYVTEKPSLLLDSLDMLEYSLHAV